MSFKVGDRVRVANSTGTQLVPNSMHYIVGVATHSVMLEGDSAHYMKWRFEHEPCPPLRKMR